MKKIVYRPNSGYFIFVESIFAIFGVLTFIGMILTFDDVECLIACILGILVEIGFSVFVFNLKFVFFDDYMVIPNGTYGDKFKKKDRTISYNNIKDVYYCDTYRGIPHIVMKVGRKKIYVNTILFSNKKAEKIEALIKEKSGIID